MCYSIKIQIFSPTKHTQTQINEPAESIDRSCSRDNSLPVVRRSFPAWSITRSPTGTYGPDEHVVVDLGKVGIDQSLRRQLVSRMEWNERELARGHERAADGQAHVEGRHGCVGWMKNS